MNSRRLSAQGGDTLGAFIDLRGTPEMRLVLDVWMAGPGSGMSTPPSAGHCDLHLRVYSASADSGVRPLWDSAHSPDLECQGGRVPHLRTFGAAEILGDSLPPGPYRLAVRLPFRGDTVELPAGVMVLTDDPRPPLKTTSGLRVHARVERVPSDSGWIRAWTAVSNPLDRRVEFYYGPGSCSMWVLAYRANDLKHPVWDSRRAWWECETIEYIAQIGPGETRREPSLTRHFRVGEILGDSLRSGPYRFAVVVELSDDTFAVDAGTLRLERRWRFLPPPAEWF